MAGSTPYFQFGAQRRYAYAWHGGAGGVPSSRVAAESRELGIFDMAESNPAGAIPWRGFSRSHLHDPTFVATSDWPLVRPAGPEPLDPREGVLAGVDFSSPKTLAVVAVAAAVGWWMWKGRERRNPAGRYVVRTRSPSGERGEIRAGSKQSAEAYAKSMRKHGYTVTVKRA